MSTARTVPLTFTLYRNGARIGEQTLTRDVIKVGKLSSAHLRIEDDSLSRMHAYVQVAGPDEIYISDLGSARGTLVNGRRVNKAKLADGDRIRLGDTEVVVTIGAPVQPAAVPTVPTGATPLVPGAPAPAMVPSAPELPSAKPAPGLQRRTSFVQTKLTDEDLEKVEDSNGHRAVEVVAKYQGSTHVVRHYGNPRAGRPRVASIVAVCLGLGLAIAGAAAFASQIVHVKRQEAYQAGVREFVKERGLPQKFVPKVRTDRTVEVAGAAGFVMGLYWLLWGAFRSRDELRKPKFTIGEHPRCTFHTPMEALPPDQAEFPLVHTDGTSFQLTFTPKMEGWAELQGSEERISLEDLVGRGLAKASLEIQGAYQLPIPDGLHANLQMGDNTFVINTVAPGKALAGDAPAAAVAGAASRPISLATFGSGAVAGLFMLLFSFKPAGAEAFDADAMESGRMTKLVRSEMKNAQKDDENKPKDKDKPKNKAKLDPKSKIKGPAGKPDDRMSHRGVGPAGPSSSSNSRSVGRSQGMAGVLQSMSGKLGSMFSRATAMSQETEDALGALTGHTVGDPSGLDGLGLGGGGRGGPSGGAGIYGPGGWNLGKGDGGGCFGCKGGGTLGFPGGGRHIADYKAKDPLKLGSRVTVEGGLTAGIIRRHIRRHKNQIRYCFVTHALATNPRAAGTVKVAFTITSQGRVSKVRIVQDTLGSARASGCMRGMIKTWRFPKPEGSMPYVVYPFHFKAIGR